MGTPSRTPAEALDLFARIGIQGIALIMQDGYKSTVPTTVTISTFREICWRASATGSILPCSTSNAESQGSPGSTCMPR